MAIRLRTINGKPQVVTAFTGGGMAGRGGVYRGTNAVGTSQSTAYLLGADLSAGLLENIFDVKDNKEIYATYRDIYYHDAICGSAVDLRANMPWSDFNLMTSGENEESLDIFLQTLEMLNVKSAHTQMATDQMITGAFVASLVYDKSNKAFIDFIPFDYSDCEVKPVPLNAHDPLLVLTISDEIREFATNEEYPHFVELQKGIPSEILRHFRESEKTVLDPLTTIYLPRATMSSVQSGVSYYRRVLPCYLLERIIYRGTITEATKRQRSTLHITVGASEDWIPNEEDMSTVVGLFQMTEQDPISSVIATRDNVQVSEVMQHSDIWSWNNISGELREIKLQALGISDSFISADGTYDAMQSSLSVYIEELRTYRDNFTRKLYYEKLFPLIAKIHKLEDKEKKGKGKEEASAQLQLQLGAGGAAIENLFSISKELNDTQNLFIPKIQWHKQLRPQGDQEYMDKLTAIEEKGLPIPLSIWASAAGISIDQIVSDLKSDKEIREMLKQYAPPKPAGGGDEFASVKDKPKPDGSLANLMNREYSEEDHEVMARTRTGKPKYIPNQREAKRKIMETSAKAMDSLSDPNEFKKALERAAVNGRGNPPFRFTR